MAVKYVYKDTKPVGIEWKERKLTGEDYIVLLGAIALPVCVVGAAVLWKAHLQR